MSAFEDVGRYALANTRVETLPAVYDARRIACIDGRRRDHSTISFPGGALGIVGTILAALHRELIGEWDFFEDTRRLETIRERLQFNDMMLFFENFLDGMSCHTDDGRHDSDTSSLACAGCGHMVNMLTNERYRLGVFKDSLLEYSQQLKVRALDRDPKVSVLKYRGQHAERAIVRVKAHADRSKVLTLTPCDEHMSVFVVNEDSSVTVLQNITAMLYEKFREAFEDLGVSRVELISYVRSVYFRHVRLSARQLAPNLLVFNVQDRGDGIQVSRSTIKY